MGDNIINKKNARRVNYLRVSVTDRCNLRCIYCSPVRNFKFFPHKEILTFEEIVRLVRIGLMLGIEKVRLTGGEPFVRRDFLKLLELLLNTFPGLDLRITTNGTLLTKDTILRLKKIGIKAINVSLDTFDRKKFFKITGKDLHHRVINAIYDLIDSEIMTKINVVALRDINQDEVLKFAKFAYENPVHVRFIEFMDLSMSKHQMDIYFYSADDILSTIKKEYALIRYEPKESAKGPARMYKIQGGLGKIGIISPISNHFCHTCNRFRITANGRLKTCLFAEKAYDLKPILRNPKLGDRFLYRIMKNAMARKPIGSKLISKQGNGIQGMYVVGG